MTFKEIIKEVAERAYKEHAIPIMQDRDFSLFGKPYYKLTEEEYSIATSIAMERHYTLNWLCGYSTDWDTTPIDT